MSIEKTLDCRGLTCPQPVILTKKALDEAPENLLVLVDNAMSKENVTKFAVASGYGVNVETEGNAYRIRLVKKLSATEPQSASQAAPLYLITQDTLGNGSE